MKKLTALLLALLLALSLAFVSCGDLDDDDKDSGKKGDSKVEDEADTDDKGKGSDDDETDSKDKDKDTDDDEDSIVGTWVYEVNITDFIESMLEEQDIELKKLDDLVLPLVFDFDKDGTMTAEIDERTFKKNYSSFIDSFKDSLLDYLEDTLKEQAKANGEDYNDYLDQFEESTGMTLDEYVDEIAEEGMDYDTLLDDLNMDDLNSDYEIDGDTIIFDGEEEWTYKLKGDKLTLDTDETVPEEFEMIFDFPITLERK